MISLSVLLPWIFGAVGVLGVGGTIAAVILFPTVVIPILQAIVARILACKTCIYVIAVIVLCSVAWWHGHHTAVVKCRDNELTAELRNKQIDLDAAKKSASDEAARASKIESDANDQHQKDATYIEDLQNVPACLLDDLDVNGMRKPVWSGRAKSPAHSK